MCALSPEHNQCNQCCLHSGKNVCMLNVNNAQMIRMIHDTWSFECFETVNQQKPRLLKSRDSASSILLIQNKAFANVSKLREAELKVLHHYCRWDDWISLSFRYIQNRFLGLKHQTHVCTGSVCVWNHKMVLISWWISHTNTRSWFNQTYKHTFLTSHTWHLSCCCSQSN